MIRATVRRMSLARWVLVSVLVVACKKEQPAPPQVTPPTLDEATAFANQFAKHMLPCDRSALAADLDIDQMVKRALAGRRMHGNEASGIKNGVSGSLVTSLCEATTTDNGVAAANAPSYALVRVRTVGGEPRPLLRLASDGGLTYHELTLDKQADRIRVADILLYATGETFSEMIGTMLDAMSDYDDANPLIDAKRRLASGDPRGARETLKRLPDTMRKTKTVMMFDVAAAAASNDDAEYLKAIDAFSGQYPDDPALDLVRVDQAFLRKDYKQVLAHLDSLDKRIGGDPFLDVQRASAYLEIGDADKAVAAAKRATERAAELQQTWWALLTAQVAAKQFAPALDTVKALETKFKISLDEATLRADPRFVPLADELAKDDAKLRARLMGAP